MGKYCVEQITMGFMFTKPKSKFIGHFETENEAIEWCRHHLEDFDEINEGESTFFQNNIGVCVIEAYIQDCENESFIQFSDYSKSKIYDKNIWG